MADGGARTRARGSVANERTTQGPVGRHDGTADTGDRKIARSPRTTRVLVVSAVRFYREGLEDALGRQQDLEVVATGVDAEEALATLREKKPDVLLLDVNAPEGPSTVPGLLAARPLMRVVVVGVRETDHDVVAYAEAGVAGYATQETSLAELARIVQQVAEGYAPCSPVIASALLSRLSALAAERDKRGVSRSRLTQREREVLTLIEEGLSNKQIARRLGIELATVKNHVHNVLAKLDAQSRSEAVARLQPARRRVREN